MIREVVGEWLNRRALERHRSRLGWREAPKYTRHWRACQAAAPRYSAAEAFRRVGYVTLYSPVDDLWGPYGNLTDFLHAVYGCEYQILYGKTYRSVSSPVRSGSQLWHADGGPGTCVIVMVYRSSVSSHDGPLQLVPWSRSLDIFKREPRGASRDDLCTYYAAQIGAEYDEIHGGPGTVIAFSNNVLHRGGYPEPGHTREASVYHVYPSIDRRVDVPTKTDAYLRV